MDFSSVLAPLSHSLLTWANSQSLTTNHTSLSHFTNAHFFKHMLCQVQSFTWVQGGDWQSFDSVSTGQRVKRMRAVGRSVIRFYRNQLDLSLDNLAFNYIQMCTNHDENDILRLFIAVLGVLVRSDILKNQLGEFLGTINQQQASLFRIMIDYASNIGEKMGKIDSPIKVQKKLVSKLESLEEDLQFYEEYTGQLERKVQSLTDQNEKDKDKLEQFMANGDKIAKKLDSLEAQNEELRIEVSKTKRQEEILLERLARNRQSAEQVVDRLMEQNQKERMQAAHFRKQLSEMMSEETDRKMLILICQEKEGHIKQLQNKLNKQTEHIFTLESELKSVQSELRKYTAENEDIRAKMQLFQKSIPAHRTTFFSPDQESIVITKRLGDSYLAKTPEEWFAVQEEGDSMNFSHCEGSLSFSQHISQTFSTYPKQGGFLTIKDLEQSENRDKENCDPNVSYRQGCILSEIDQQKSMEMSHNEDQLKKKLPTTVQAELELAMNTIFDLYSNLQSARKELRSYKAKQALKADRSARFSAKVNAMFA